MTARVRPDLNSFYNYQLLRLTLRQVMRLTANSELPWPVNIVGIPRVYQFASFTWAFENIFFFLLFLFKRFISVVIFSQII